MDEPQGVRDTVLEVERKSTGQFRYVLSIVAQGAPVREVTVHRVPRPSPASTGRSRARTGLLSPSSVFSTVEWRRQPLRLAMVSAVSIR